MDRLLRRRKVSFIRKGKNPDVCNFTPVPLMHHRVGVPKAGNYKEIFNSDNEKYGGSGIINSDIISSQRIGWNWRENSMEMKVPPLGICALKLQ